MAISSDFTGTSLDGYQTQVTVESRPTIKDLETMLEFFGIKHDEKTQCPECDVMLQMRSLLVHLNDKGSFMACGSEGNYNVPNHGWTFKQIGKWLEEMGY